MVTAPDAVTLHFAPPRPATRGRLLAATAMLPLVLPLVWSGYRVSLLPDTARAALSPLEAPWSIRDPLGVWALLLVVAWFGLAYHRRRADWWELPFVLLGAAVVLPRLGNAWLAAPLLVLPLGMQLRNLRVSRAVTVVAAVVCVALGLALLLRVRPPELPAEVATTALTTQGTVFADYRWAPALQQRLAGRSVLGSNGIDGESTDYWLDYLRVLQGHERWASILRDLGVRALILAPEQRQQLALALVRGSPEWRVLVDDDRAFVAERTP